MSLLGNYNNTNNKNTNNKNTNNKNTNNDTNIHLQIEVSFVSAATTDPVKDPAKDEVKFCITSTTDTRQRVPLQCNIRADNCFQVMCGKHCAKEVVQTLFFSEDSVFNTYPLQHWDYQSTMVVRDVVFQATPLYYYGVDLEDVPAELALSTCASFQRFCQEASSWRPDNRFLGVFGCTPQTRVWNDDTMVDGKMCERVVLSSVTVVVDDLCTTNGTKIPRGTLMPEVVFVHPYVAGDFQFKLTLVNKTTQHMVFVQYLTKELCLGLWWDNEFRQWF